MVKLRRDCSFGALIHVCARLQQVHPYVLVFYCASDCPAAQSGYSRITGGTGRRPSRVMGARGKGIQTRLKCRAAIMPILRRCIRSPESSGIVSDRAVRHEAGSCHCPSLRIEQHMVQSCRAVLFAALICLAMHAAVWADCRGHDLFPELKQEAPRRLCRDRECGK